MLSVNIKDPEVTECVELVSNPAYYHQERVVASFHTGRVVVSPTRP